MNSGALNRKSAVGVVALAAVFTAAPASAQIFTTAAQIAAADAAQTSSAEPAGEARPVAVVAGVRDPWEGLNRDLFGVNVFVDDNFLVPLSKGYRAVTPKPGRRGIGRFLANLRAPGVFVNDILQGEFGRAGETLGRFVVNTTIGAGGFADPAAQLGVPAHSEDFGQTLAVWGVPSGPYTFFPFFGPGTVRSNVGLLGQLALNPLLYFSSDPVQTANLVRSGVGVVSAREPLIEPLQEIRDNSLDYYASFRSFYLQARVREIANGRDRFDALPDFEDFDDFDDDLDALDDESLDDNPVDPNADD
ncbi:MAG: VacJ family lipoprotein [Pseudomonadota bacterium]